MTVSQTADAGFDLHHLLPPDLFAREGRRPTVTILPIIGQNGIGFVKPNAAKDDPNWWVLPQGRLQPGDGTVITGAMRVMEKKLGVNMQELQNCRAVALFRFDNEIPSDRVEGLLVKEHYVVALQIPAISHLFPNRNVIRGVEFAKDVKTFTGLTTSVATKRPVKHKAILRAISEVSWRNMIPFTLQAPKTVQ